MVLSKIRIFGFISWALFWTCAINFTLAVPVEAGPASSPALNPPRFESDAARFDYYSALTHAPLPAREWTYHKSSDNLHPDGNEQQFMWLMNRARSNPAQEGTWLANTGDAGIEGAIRYWGVDLPVMQNEFDGYRAKPPAAFDVRLYNAARAHSLDLIARNAQDHTGQFDPRVRDSGFHYTQGRGNVFSYTDNALYGHAAFNIDWGDDGGDGTGMQNPRGHRLAIMSIDGDYTNVGLAAIAVTDPATRVGPIVTTANFCYADTYYADHYNRFLVGTVWRDANHNDQYDPGEGMAGITVIPNDGPFFAITANSGGYAFPIATSGSYDVTFSGNGIGTPVIRRAAVATDSVMLDLKYTGNNANEPEAVTLPASDMTDTAVNLNGMVYVNGSDTTYHFQYGPTTNYGSSTAPDTVSVDIAVSAVITGLTAGTTYHYRVVATNGQGTSYGIDQVFHTDVLTTSSAPTSTPTSTSGSGGGGGGCFIHLLTDGNPGS